MTLESVTSVSIESVAEAKINISGRDYITLTVHVHEVFEKFTLIENLETPKQYYFNFDMWNINFYN